MSKEKDVAEKSVELVAAEQPLSVQEQIEQIRLRTELMKLKLAERDILEFEEKMANEARVTAIRVDSMLKQMEEEKHRQSMCKHKTGGKGKDGFLNGDGTHGFCVIHHVLPTGELYLMCTRCQKEWHHPAWTVKIEIYWTSKCTMTKSQYDKQLAEYAESLSWGHEYTSIAEASRFVIPMLDRIDVSQVKFAPEKAAV